LKEHRAQRTTLMCYHYEDNMGSCLNPNDVPKVIAIPHFACRVEEAALSAGLPWKLNCVSTVILQEINASMLVERI